MSKKTGNNRKKRFVRAIIKRRRWGHRPLSIREVIPKIQEEKIQWMTTKMKRYERSDVISGTRDNVKMNQT